MKPYDLIERYKLKKGLKSDNAVAKELGLTRGAISAVKHGGSLSVENAWTIAEVIGMDPAEAVAICKIAQAERSDDKEGLQVWKRRFQAVTHSAATIFGVIAIPYWGEVVDKLCILCQIDHGSSLRARLGF